MTIGNFQFWRMALVAVVAFLASLSITPLVKNLLIRFGVVDMPSSRRINKQPIPRGGGIAVIASCVISLLFGISALGINDPVWTSSGTPFFAAAFAVIIAAGIIDDIKGLNPFVKLAAQIVAAILVFAGGASFGHLILFRVPEWLDCLITIGWFVIIVNAFNLIDGLDGLASGLAVIGALGLAVCLVIRGHGEKTLSLFILIGACIGFLRYNFNPAQIFLGDTGSLFLGFSLALLPLVTGGKTVFIASIGAPLLAVGLPLFDTFLAIVRRTARAFAGGDQGLRTIVMPDVEHLHHRLLRVGMSQRGAALVFYLLASVLVIASIILTVDNDASGAIIGGLLVMFAILGRQLANVELWYVGNAVTGAMASVTWRVLALVYVSLDVAIVAIGWFVAADLALVPHIGLKGLHLARAFAPFFICIFIMFMLFKIYRRRWDRSQNLDLIVLIVATVAGWLAAYSYVSIAGKPYLGFDRHAQVFLALIIAPLLLARMIRTSLRACVTALASARTDVSAKKTRIAVIGSGIGFYGFYYLVKNGVEGFADYSVVALSDFRPNTIGNYTQGFKVLDARNELAKAIDAKGVQKIVVASATGYSQEEYDFAEALAKEKDIPLGYFSAKVVPPEGRIVGKADAKRI